MIDCLFLRKNPPPDSLVAYLEILQGQQVLERINISNKSLVEYEKLGLSFRCESDSMDARLRVVDSSVGFQTFFDSVSFRLLRDAAKIIQENHYYPFGQNMVGIEEKDQQSLSSQEEQKFQYNAKEKLDEFGLYWNDHGARNLDLQTGRWTAIDPLAEKFSHQSPYCGMDNNPVNLSDPTGMAAEGGGGSLLGAAWDLLKGAGRKIVQTAKAADRALENPSFKNAGLFLEVATPNVVALDTKKLLHSPAAAALKKAILKTKNTPVKEEAVLGNPSLSAKGTATLSLTGNTETDGYATAEVKGNIETTLIQFGTTTSKAPLGLEVFGGFVISSEKAKEQNLESSSSIATTSTLILGQIKADWTYDDENNYKFRIGITSNSGALFKQAIKYSSVYKATKQVQR